MSMLRVSLLIFVGYVATVAAFGGAYFTIYRRDASAFAMNSDINDTQLKSWFRLRQRQRRANEALVTLVASWRNPSQSFEVRLQDEGRGPVQAIVHAGDFYFDIKESREAVPKLLNMQPVVTVTAHERDGFVLSSWRFNFLSLREYLAITSSGPSQDQLFNRLIAAAAVEIERSNAGLAKSAWSYWDFLYFSAITATTVGYGDMLPNSTSVRMVVVAQTLVSLFIVLVVFNVAVSSLSSSGRNPGPKNAT